MKCSKCPNDAQAKHRYCRACQRAYDRARHQRNRAKRQQQIREYRVSVREWMDDIKASRACADCGESYPPVVMEWDHVDPSMKAADVANLVKDGKKLKAAEEIKKCDLVCANCHRLRHADRAAGI